MNVTNHSQVFSSFEKISILNEKWIGFNQKIQNTKNHIAHLSEKIVEKKTHGGKRCRARKVSIKNQIQTSTARLSLLLTAKWAVQFEIATYRSTKRTNILEKAILTCNVFNATFCHPRVTSMAVGNSSPLDDRIYNLKPRY